VDPGLRRDDGVSKRCDGGRIELGPLLRLDRRICLLHQMIDRAADRQRKELG